MSQWHSWNVSRHESHGSGVVGNSCNAKKVIYINVSGKNYLDQLPITLHGYYLQPEIITLCFHYLLLHFRSLLIHISIVNARITKFTYLCLLFLWSKLLGQGYIMGRLKSSLRKFYGRYGDLIKHYMTSPSPTCYMTFWDMTLYNDTLTELDFNTDFDLITEFWRFP